VAVLVEAEWADLSPTAKAAVGWAAASRPDGEVGTRSLLFGVLRTAPEESDPVQLLRYFGIAPEELVGQLEYQYGAAHVRIDATTPLELSRYPKLSQNATTVLAEAATLARESPTVTQVDVAQLLGGLMAVPRSGAFLVLDAMLSPRARFATVRECYRDYLVSDKATTLRAILAERFPRTADKRPAMPDSPNVPEAVQRSLVRIRGPGGRELGGVLVSATHVVTATLASNEAGPDELPLGDRADVDFPLLGAGIAATVEPTARGQGWIALRLDKPVPNALGAPLDPPPRGGDAVSIVSVLADGQAVSILEATYSDPNGVVPGPGSALPPLVQLAGSPVWSEGGGVVGIIAADDSDGQRLVVVLSATIAASLQLELRAGSRTQEDRPPERSVGTRDGSSPVWRSDGISPGQPDLLGGRGKLADEIAYRFDSIRKEAREPGSFLLHLDAPWGAGKSWLLSQLATDLRQRGWLVVEVSAWRERAVRPVWYLLLARLRASIRDDLTRGRSHGWSRRVVFRLREQWHRVASAGPALWFAVAIVAFALLAVGWLLATTHSLASSLDTTSKAVVGTISLIVAVFGAAALVGRFVFWDSPTSARFFERNVDDPMERVRSHISWLLQLVGDSRAPGASNGRPATGDGAGLRAVAFLIDELDRCEHDYVVELLDTLQTLVRDSGPQRLIDVERDGVAPRRAATGPYIVVAADGAWLRSCYDRQYEMFRSAVERPGQPLGYTFLDKIFQLSVRIPRLTATRQKAFLGSQLRPDQKTAGAAAGQDLVKEAENATSREQIESVVAQARDLDPDTQLAVAGAAIDALRSDAIAAATTHWLETYVDLLPPNPRAIKRFVNAYGLAEAVDTIEVNAPARSLLARWTIMRLRWPALVDELTARPDLIGPTDPATAPEPVVKPDDEWVRDLLGHPDVQAVLRFRDEAPIDRAAVDRLTGRSQEAP
jgi:hypothetical protein